MPQNTPAPDRGTGARQQLHLRVVSETGNNTDAPVPTRKHPCRYGSFRTDTDASVSVRARPCCCPSRKPREDAIAGERQCPGLGLACSVASLEGRAMIRRVLIPT